MKVIGKKILALILILTMFQLQGIQIQAEEISDNQQIANQNTGMIEETFINPLYADIITEEDLICPDEASDITAYAEEEYSTSIEECALSLREGMQQRAENVKVYYQVPEYVGGYAKQILDQALVHTGVPNEGDYLKWQYGGCQASTSYFTDNNGMCCMTITFTCTYYTTEEQETVLHERMNEVLAELNVYEADDYEKVRAIYDYICTHVLYDNEHVDDKDYKLQYTAYGALINGKAVCQGYSVLFYRMALELGVDNRLIPGKGKNESHGWNIVKLGKHYYNADTTWDCQKEEYQYFLKCDENFINHTRDKDYATEEFYASYPMAEKDFKRAEKMVLDQSTCEIEVGDNVSLTAVCDPVPETRSEIEWWSDNEEVASVDEDGIVTGNDKGTAVITAYYGGREAKCSVKVTKPSVVYQTHVQSKGWEESWRGNWSRDGEISGTEGNSLRLEAIQINLQEQKYEGGVEYQTHVESRGWENDWKKRWCSNGEISGTTGAAKRLEAIQIKLTGEMANHYNIYYRVHAQSYGWLNWAKNGEMAGTSGLYKRLEAIQIVLVKNGAQPPENDSSESREFISDTGYSNTNYITYQTHIQTYGWQEWKYDGVISGTEGEAKRLEGIKIKLADPKFVGSIEYQTHVQTFGWEEDWKGRWCSEGELSGTEAQSRRLEAIMIRLTGDLEGEYDVYYRVHSQTFGWLGWAKNGEPAGTEGYAKRLEGIQIVLVKKGGEAPEGAEKAFYSANT